MMKLLQVEENQYLNVEFIVSIFASSDERYWTIRYHRPGTSYDSFSIESSSIYMVGLRTLIEQSVIPFDSKEF